MLLKFACMFEYPGPSAPALRPRVFVHPRRELLFRLSLSHVPETFAMEI